MFLDQLDRTPQNTLPATDEEIWAGGVPSGGVPLRIPTSSLKSLHTQCMKAFCFDKIL